MNAAIFKAIFKPIFKPIFNSNQGNIPPKSSDLISWTFADMLDDLFSKDRIKASDEPAKFINSYCVSFPGGTGNEINYGNNYSVGTNSHTIAAWIRPAAFSAFQGIISKRNGTTSEYTFYVNSGVLGVYDGNAVYNSTASLSLNAWQHVAYTYDYATKKVRFYLNGTFVDEYTLVQGFAISSAHDMRIGIVNAGVSQSFNGCIFSVRLFNSKLSDADINTIYSNIYQTFPSEIGTFVFQGSTFDLIRKVRANSIVGVTFSQNNDLFHYNLLHGFDKYSEDANPTNIIYVPYVSGNPIVSSVAGFTKISSHPAGKWHNGAETQIVVGTTGVKDGTGWIAKADNEFLDKAGNTYTRAEADPNEIFIRHTTAPVGYCKTINVNTLPAVSAGDYIFMDKSNTNKYKNLLWYAIAPTYLNSLKAHVFINKKDFITDDNAEYVYDDNGFIVTEV